MKTKRNFWPWGIGLAFSLFFCGLTTAIIIATTHGESLVSENYYEQELGFQNQIDGYARAQKCGAAINYESGSKYILINLAFKNPEKNSTGQIKLYRPSGANLDRQLPFAPDSGGKQLLDTTGLPAGLWKISVTWNLNHEDYYLDQKIVIADK